MNKCNRIVEAIGDYMGAIFLAIMMLCIGSLVWAFVYQEKVEMPNSYRAWCKQTGNPKELTYTEWRSLVRVHQPEKPIEE